MNFTNTFFSDVVHLLYPHVCAGCGSDVISRHHVICLECIADMPVTGFCFHKQNPVEKIFRGRLTLSNASAHVYFTKDSAVQNMLHRLKYSGMKEIGIFMGQLMAGNLKRSTLYQDVDAVVPLPLNARKQKTRGYNQAALIAEGIGTALNIPVLNNVVARKKYTETQTHKSRAERWNNIEGKFAVVDAGGLKDMHVLLVDDVITTGATLESCGMELLKTAGLRLSIAAFAYTAL